MNTRNRVTAFVVVLIIGLCLPAFEARNFRTEAPEDCPADYPKYSGAVVTNGIECSKFGGDMLRKGGSAADAAIAALLCEGVSIPEAMGVGGGFFMTIYNKESGTMETLDARDTAPAAATKDMYHGNPELSRRGGLSVAIPGEIKGYWELHKKYGKLPWADLFQPTIDLCRRGIPVTKYLAQIFRKEEAEILAEPTMKEILIDPTTGKALAEGTVIKRLKLADTLEIVAKEGGDALYKGSLTAGFVKDIADKGGIITEKDMNDYKILWKTSVSTHLNGNNKMYTAPLPSSGSIVAFIMNILNGYLDTTKMYTVQNWQRIIESFKFGYGRRTNLGDPDFEPAAAELGKRLIDPSYAAEVRAQILDNETFQNGSHYGGNIVETEDHGTANLCVLAPNGDAIAVTSTINLVLGAMFRSKTTGIILNDGMDDFSAPNITNAFNLPPSPTNFIKPGKRPLSSMSPSIVLDDKGDVRLVIGAAGGSKIITQVALGMIRNLYFNQPLFNSVNDRRLHHQLYPMKVLYEATFDKTVLDGLCAIGHVLEEQDTSDGFTATTAISRQCGSVFGQFDPRRQGSVDLL